MRQRNKLLMRSSQRHLEGWEYCSPGNTDNAESTTNSCQIETDANRSKSIAVGFEVQIHKHQICKCTVQICISYFDAGEFCTTKPSRIDLCRSETIWIDLHLSQFDRNLWYCTFTLESCMRACCFLHAA